MNFAPPLEKTILKKRYKRFLADVEHPTLNHMTVHCPNTGSMKNCWEPGWFAWIQDSQNPKRKYQYSWVLSENPQGELIGINSQGANGLVFEAIQDDKISELMNVESVETEVKYGEENSRIDLLVKHSDQSLTYIEVKSVTLKGVPDENRDLVPTKNDAGESIGCFPDAVTTRGQKHIRELIHCVSQGHRAILFFMVQHTGIGEVNIAKTIDPAYAKLIEDALNHGVEIVAYRAAISAKSINLSHAVPFNFG
jgi:sugar fermentation stimulation protein A